MLKFAVLGYGVVGSGVVELFYKNKSKIEKKAGRPMDVKYILDIREFPDSPYKNKFVKTIDEIINDNEIKAVAECMGGVEPAYTFSKKCLENGIDISKDFIPVAPAAHYMMGGIKTNIEGETSVRGLYAIGETASTGLHGGNRLASNSLLECVVCAYEVANYLKTLELQPPKQISVTIKDIIEKYSDEIYLEEIDVSEMRKNLQNIMWEGAGIYRSEETLKNAFEKIEQLKLDFHRTDKCLSKSEYEFKNMLTVAEMVITSAIKRKESRGAHFRTDFTQTNDMSFHSCLTRTSLEDSKAFLKKQNSEIVSYRQIR